MKVRTMASAAISESQRPSIWAFAALPPPVDGMTLLTEKVIHGIEQVQPVKVFNRSAGDARKCFRNRMVRVLRAAGGLVRLVLHGRVRNARLFLTGNSEAGLLMTGLFVRAGRALGYQICLHHHSYLYIDNFDPKMAWIDRAMTADDFHLVHCQKMAAGFQARYASKARFEFLYPSIVSLPIGRPRQSLLQPMRLGHLGHLCVAKGTHLVIDTFRTLRERGLDVRLSLAGPCHTAEAERMIEQAVRENEGLVEHLGGIQGARKTEYFNSIDCFLFPSQTESWGIVLNEAMAAGVPVIATNRGCVSEFVRNGAGLVVDDEKHYVAEAVGQIVAWIDSHDQYAAASKAAIEQADVFHREAQVQLERVISCICSPVGSTAGEKVNAADM